MVMLTSEIDLDTSNRRFVEVTGEAERFLSEAGAADGLLNVYAPHATAGVALMETGAGSESDLEQAIDRLLPREDIYTHRHGSKGHGADHLIPAFISPSVTIPIVGGKPAFGTWQSIVLVDLNRDNPRRKLRLSFLAG
jgi:secondary thiamine-phosphate synthase enzyme